MDYPRWNHPPIDLGCFYSHFVDLCWRLAHPESYVSWMVKGVMLKGIAYVRCARPPIPPIPAQPRCSSKRWHLPFLCQQRIARYLRKQESYNIPLEHSWSTTQTPKWREFLHKLLVSRILGVCFFRVYIFQTLFDMIFTLVKCCSETPTPHPQ